MPKNYPVRKTPDGYVIEGVEIFELGEHRGFNYDRDWFGRLKTNHDAFDAIGFNPPIIVGHNIDPTKEKAKIAGFRNISLAADDKTVRADYLLLESDGTPETLKLFSKFPQRSVEVLNQKACFTAIAQLGGTEPHFHFPDLNPKFFSAVEEQPVVIQFAEEEMTLTEVVDQIKNEQALSDLDWAFYRKMYAIKDSTEMSVEQKRAALVELIDEWAGLAKEVVTESVPDAATQMAAVRESEAFKALEAQLEQFRAKERADLLQSLRQAGVAPVFVSRFEALLKALPTDSDRKVRFAANRGQTEQEIGLPEFITDTLAKMAAAGEKGTFIVAMKPLPKPFSKTDGTPQVHDSKTDDPSQPKNFAAAEKIKAHLKSKGLENYNHLQYAQAKNELIAAGEIEVE